MRECSWDLDAEDCCEPSESPGEERVEQLISVVSAMMSRWSGYTIGACTETVRPLDICGECRGWCCGGRDGIRLSSNDGSPVSAVTAVRVDGVPLDESEYRYDAARGMLWKVGGAWPMRDDRGLEDTEPGTFAVDVVTGAEPDAWALWVANVLLCEMIRDCIGDSQCRLPRNATQVSGQGVTIQLTDDEIQHSLPEVSAWVAAVNPHGARLPARIISPEVSGRRRGERSRRGALAVVAAGSGGCCGR